MTEEQILNTERITPEIAGKFLGCPAQFVRSGLQYQRLPFGSAVPGKRWSYYISGQALVKYKKQGAELQAIPD